MKTMTTSERIEAIAEKAARECAAISRRNARHALNNTTADVRALARSLARFAEYPWDAQARIAGTSIDDLLREVRIRHRAARANREGVERRGYYAGLYVDLRVQKAAGAERCQGQISQLALDMASAVLSGQAFVISRRQA